MHLIANDFSTKFGKKKLLHNRYPDLPAYQNAKFLYTFVFKNDFEGLVKQEQVHLREYVAKIFGFHMYKHDNPEVDLWYTFSHTKDLPLMGSHIIWVPLTRITQIEFDVRWSDLDRVLVVFCIENESHLTASDVPPSYDLRVLYLCISLYSAFARKCSSNTQVCAWATMISYLVYGFLYHGNGLVKFSGSFATDTLPGNLFAVFGFAWNTCKLPRAKGFKIFWGWLV